MNGGGYMSMSSPDGVDADGAVSGRSPDFTRAVHAVGHAQGYRDDRTLSQTASEREKEQY